MKGNRKIKKILTYIDMSFWIVAAIGIISFGLIIYSHISWQKSIQRHLPSMENLEHAITYLTRAHLWFEEAIDGDTTVNIEDVWSIFDSANEAIDNCIAGKSTISELAGKPFVSKELLHDLEDLKISMLGLKDIAIQRWNNFPEGGIGSPLDQKFDSAFKEIIQNGSTVNLKMHAMANDDIAAQNRMFYLLVSLWGIGVAGAILLILFINRTRKKAEKALSENEKWLSITLKSIGDAVIATDKRGFVTFINHVAETLTGWKHEDAIGRSINDTFNIINEETGEPVENPVERVLREGMVVGLANHTVLISKDGSRIPIDDSGAPIKDDKGNTFGVILVFHDITEGRQAEEELRKNKEELQTIFDSVPSTIWYKDKENRIIRVNKAAAKSVSISVEDIEGKTAYELFPEHAEKYFEDDLEVMNSGKPKLGIIEPLKIPSGETRWVRTDKVPYRDDHGNIIGVIAFVVDITEHKKADEALAAESERLAVTLRSIGDGVITTDTKGNVTLLNKIAESLTGWSEKEAKGKPVSRVFNIINEETRHPCENPVEKVIEKGLIVGLANHTVLISRDGTERFLADSGAPIRNKNGEVIGVVLCFRDVTEARRMQEFFSRAQRLETAGRIAGQVAHDFNNLLGPLVAYPDFIRESLPKDHKAIPFLNDMETAADQIADINQQLLTLGRRGHYNQEPLNLNLIIMRVIDQLYPVPDTLTVENDLHKNLLNIRGGASQIHRLVANIIDNACDAMQNIGRLAIKTENYYADTNSGQFGRVPKGEYVKLTISDTGCGIPEDIKPRIFDPFFTTKTTDKRRGSGLGLSVALAVVEDHNGYIDLESAVGKRTAFYIYFPITREAIETDIIDEIVGGSESVLVVDDDQVQQDVTVKLLLKLGYRANAVSSGEKAIEFIKENRQDLLILDMVMPDGIDGAETFQKALEINPSQKAIIVSGFAESERVEMALKLGAGTYIRKPLTLKTIASAVRKELDRKAK